MTRRQISALFGTTLVPIACRPRTDSDAVLAGAEARAAEGGSFPEAKAEKEDFFYAQQTCLTVFAKAPLQKVRASVGSLLDQLGLVPATFETNDHAYVVLKPMVFAAEFGQKTALSPGMSLSTEVELCLLCVPANTPKLGEGVPFSDYLFGRGAAVGIGQLRLDVICDNEIAVSAGRVNFGEHKYLGMFEYRYPTANALVGRTEPFHLEMSVHTWRPQEDGADLDARLIFKMKASLAGLVGQKRPSMPEILYSSFPPEPEPNVKPQTVREARWYSSATRAYEVRGGDSRLELILGRAMGSEALRPAAPFGDAQPISGSEAWPKALRERIATLIEPRAVVGFWLYQPLPAEYESKPVPI